MATFFRGLAGRTGSYSPIPESFSAKLQKIGLQEASARLVTMLGSFEGLTALMASQKAPETPQDYRDAMSHLVTNVCSPATTPQVLDVLTATFNSPEALTVSEMGQLKEMFTKVGIGEDLLPQLTTVLDTSYSGNKAGLCQYVRHVLVQYQLYQSQNEPGANVVLGQEEVSLQTVKENSLTLLGLLVKTGPKESVDAYILTLREKGVQVLTQTGMSREKAGNVFDKYALGSNRDKQADIVNFLMSKPSAASYHPQEALTFYYQTCKGEPEGFIPAVKDTLRSGQFNVAQRKELISLYQALRPTISRSERPILDKYLDNLVKTRETPFEDVKATLRFWKNLAYRQELIAQGKTPAEADTLTAQLTVHQALVSETEGTTTIPRPETVRGGAAFVAEAQPDSPHADLQGYLTQLFRVALNQTSDPDKDTVASTYATRMMATMGTSPTAALHLIRALTPSEASSGSPAAAGPRFSETAMGRYVEAVLDLGSNPTAGPHLEFLAQLPPPGHEDSALTASLLKLGDPVVSSPALDRKKTVINALPLAGLVYFLSKDTTPTTVQKTMLERKPLKHSLRLELTRCGFTKTQIDATLTEFSRLYRESPEAGKAFALKILTTLADHYEGSERSVSEENRSSVSAELGL